MVQDPGLGRKGDGVSGAPGGPGMSAVEGEEGSAKNWIGGLD